ncbi:hypothetical protein ACPJXG_22625 [Janthinobacterium sp. NFX145]|uniref:hypothetical protein n=1 Tax=Janthinobacterium sp. NFX145 TaxID=3415602 RepID=UPI003CC6B565
MNIIHDAIFEDGYFSVKESIILFRGMKRKNLHSMNQDWEAWIKCKDEVIAYKTSFKLKKLKIIVICFFEKDDGLIKFWDFGPENCMDGFQSKPEGKYTRRLRRWFLDEFAITLPQSGPWGKIDACHDPHNHTTSVFCAYQ